MEANKTNDASKETSKPGVSINPAKRNAKAAPKDGGTPKPGVSINPKKR